MPNEVQKKVLFEASQWLNVNLGGEPVSSVQEFCKVINIFGKRDNPNGWLFRGEAFLYDTPLTPSIFRGGIAPTNTKYPDRTITDIEIEEIEKCQLKVKDGEINDRYIKAFLPMIHPEDVNWLPLTQHFGFKTRLLDVSINPLVALYFACEELHKSAIDENDDAFVYAFSSGSFRPLNINNEKKGSTFDYPRIPISYLDLYDVDKELKRDYDKLPYLFGPTIPQERLQAQAGRFLFWRSLEPVLQNGQIIPIRIRASEKQFILKELTAFGISKATLFPSED